MPHLLYLKGEETVKCAYCGKAIKKADQRDSAYQLGMGHMHNDCRSLFLARRMNDLAAGVYRNI